MRYLVAIDDYERDTVFIDISQDMLIAHPELAFKMGEVVELFIWYGGKSE